MAWLVVLVGSQCRALTEGRVHRRVEHACQGRDVVKRLEAEHRVLDGVLAASPDHSVGQTAVLVHDLGVGELVVPGAAWLGDHLLASCAVMEGDHETRGEALTFRQGVVGLLATGVSSVDEPPHIVAIDASFAELVDEHSPSRSATATA